MTQHLEAVAAADPDPEERLSRSSGKYKKLCATHPDATMATSSAGRHLQPSYKQHTAVDDRIGIGIDVEIVTGEESAFGQMAERLDQIEATLARVPVIVTADAGYGPGQVHAEMQARRIDTILPHRSVTRRRGSRGYPMGRCKYDPLNDIVRCPHGQGPDPRV